MLFSPVARLFLLALLVLNLTAWTASAQEEKPKPVVIKVTEAHRSKEKDGTSDTVELGDDLVVQVENLDALLEKARSTSPAKKILLFLDGRPFKDVTPFPPMDSATSILNFPLRRTEYSRDAWTSILGQPDSFEPREISVSIGLEDGYPMESDAKVKFRVIRIWWFWFWVGLFVVLLVACIRLASESELLRDPVPASAGGARRPYSLARMQAAWWFFLVLASYLFIGMITGDYSTTITGTVLVLVGISAGTSVGSAMIDAGKPLPAVANTPTCQGWWKDILSDSDGVSIHRFQIAGWTLVLGVIFVVQVYQGLAMPTFDTTLLSLMGISSGTYLGLKIPEKK